MLLILQVEDSKANRAGGALPTLEGTVWLTMAQGCSVVAQAYQRAIAGAQGLLRMSSQYGTHLCALAMLPGSTQRLDMANQRRAHGSERDWVLGGVRGCVEQLATPEVSRDQCRKHVTPRGVN